MKKTPFYALLLTLCISTILVRAKDNITKSSTGKRKALKPPLRILYDNDYSNMVQCRTPVRERPIFHLIGIESDDEDRLSVRDFEQTISEVSGQGLAIGYKFNPGGFGRTPVWQNTRYTGYSPAAHYSWFKSTYESGDRLGALDWFTVSGGDGVQTFLDIAARYADLEPILSIRMNDAHYIWYLDDPPGHVKLGAAANLTRFLKNHHPEYFIDDCNVKWKGPENYALEPVRARRMNMLKDLIHEYDPEGIELNFMRFPRYFKDEVPLDQRRSVMTDFIRSVKTELDRSGFIHPEDVPSRPEHGSWHF
jgi:hypothetical protein